MKRIIVLLSLLILFSSTSIIQAQTDSVDIKTKIETAPQKAGETTKTESTDKAEKNIKSKKGSGAEPDKDLNVGEAIGANSSPLVFVIVVAFFLVMILMILIFFNHLRKRNQPIGYQSIKLIGLILIFPGICILAIVGGDHILSNQTLAVLLGTIAGYVLSRDDDAKDTGQKGKKTDDGKVNDKETEYKNKIKELEDKIAEIKLKNPGLIG